MDQSPARPIKGFKSKTINKILTGKFISWTKSIDDEAVRKLVEDNTIITGGSIVSMLLGEQINDFDVYFKTVDAAKAVAEYYVKKLKANPPPAFADLKDKIEVIVEPAIIADETVERSGKLMTKGPQPPRVRVVVNSRGLRGEAMVEDYQHSAGEITDPTEPATYEGNTEALDDIPAKTLADKKDAPSRGAYHVLFITANAITLSDQIQIVLRFQGDVNEIHTNYDFTHCTSAWTSWDKRLILRQEALECILSRELRYQGSKYPIASVIRTRKFLTRGWTINAGQYVKMAFQIGELDLNDPAVLEDQLVGVDSMYFTMLIEQLKQQMNKEAEANPGQPYRVMVDHLVSLIDKIF